MKALNIYIYIYEAMFIVIVDSSDVYYHVSLHPKSRKFVSTVYEYRALPMKLHYSPKIVTRITKFCTGKFRRNILQMVIYI